MSLGDGRKKIHSFASRRQKGEKVCYFFAQKKAACRRGSIGYSSEYWSCS